MSNNKRDRINFTEEFKEQIVKLYLNGKSKSDIRKEYDFYPSPLDKWIKQNKDTGSFKTKDNLTDEQKNLIELRKRNRQLEMENDILKQATLDNGTKVTILKANSYKYSISAMCDVLNIPRNSYYYESKIQNSNSDDDYSKVVIKAFKKIAEPMEQEG